MAEPNGRVEIYLQARRLLQHLYELYLEHGHLRWDYSVDDDDVAEMLALGMTVAEGKRALDVLETKRLVRASTLHSVELDQFGVDAVEDLARLDRLLPVARAAGLVPRGIEGGVDVAELEQHLSFVREVELRSLLARDLDELRRAMDTGLVKASLILCGSILEALLLDVVSRRSDLAAAYRPKKKFPDGFSLCDFIEIVVGEQIVPEAVGKMANCVVDHRDLIHPAAEQRRATKIDTERAVAMAAFLRVVTKDLADAYVSGAIAAFENR